MIRIAKPIMDWLGVKPFGEEYATAVNRKLDRHRLLMCSFRDEVRRNFTEFEIAGMLHVYRGAPRLSADQEWDYLCQAVRTLPRSGIMDSVALENKLNQLDLIGRCALFDLLDGVMHPVGAAK